MVLTVWFTASLFGRFQLMTPSVTMISCGSRFLHKKIRTWLSFYINRTHRIFWKYLTQWAAVRMNWSLTKVPPQNCPSLLSIKAAIQGQSPKSAGSPFRTLVPKPSFGAEPHSVSPKWNTDLTFRPFKSERFTCGHLHFFHFTSPFDAVLQK